MTKTHALAEHVMSAAKPKKAGFSAPAPRPGEPGQDLDSRIEASIWNSYNFKTHLKGDNIKAFSSEGRVTLSGIVYQDHHKSLAQETVAELTGVRSVNNQISVVADQPTEQSDGWISMKVKAVLTFHKNVHAAGIEVHTQHGVVTLSGNANSEAQKQLTGEYAKDVEGVTAVRNKLLVSEFDDPAHGTLGELVDDASITAQIKTSLLFHKSTHTLATQVVTQDGAVTLSGEARNGAEKELATRLAEDIQDVKQVTNLMIVRNP